MPLIDVELFVADVEVVAAEVEDEADGRLEGEKLGAKAPSGCVWRLGVGIG